jgi:hypothetical protein
MPKDCCYEEMSPIKNEHAEDSEQIHDREPYVNRYEESRPGSKGLDQSGMK